VLLGTAIATGVNASKAAEWAPNPHYPDPSIKVLDPSFLKYRPSVVGIERLATGLAWSEGPAGLAMDDIFSAPSPASRALVAVTRRLAAGQRWINH
jgi:hypothetical protein